MTRQEKVVGMLQEGFGIENVEQAVTATEDGTIYLTVYPHEGRFAIDKFGDIGEIPKISAELAYWINIDLQCLDLLETEEGK